jgi:hypothetical protein
MGVQLIKLLGINTVTLKGDTGATGDTGPNEVTTATDTNIIGLIAGDGSNIRQAIPGTDYVAAETDPVFAASEAHSFATGDKDKLDGIQAGAQSNIPVELQLGYIQSSGLLWGADLSIDTDTTKFVVAPGAVVIVDNYTDPENPVKTLVSWDTPLVVTDPYIATADTVYIGMDATGAFFYTLDDPFTTEQRRQYASIGWTDHVGRTEIEFVGMEPAGINSIAAQFQSLLYAMGSFNLSGNEYTYSTGLAIRRTSGNAWCPNQNYENEKNNPHEMPTNAENPAGIWYFYRSADGWVNDTPLGSVVDPEHYDDGSGTLAAMPTGKWQIQPISYYPLWEANDIQYGQAVYDDLAAAESALQESISVDPYNSVDVFRGWLIVKQGATDLSNPAQAKFKSSGKWGMMDVQSGGGTGGEINTGSSIGTAGVAVYDSKSGVDLRFRSVNANSAKLTVTLDAVNHIILVDLGTVTSDDIGDGSTYKQYSATEQANAATAYDHSQATHAPSNAYAPSGTDVAIADGGTGQSTAQLAINALSQVAAATNEYVLTKDTGTGNAIFKVAAGGGISAADAYAIACSVAMGGF